MFTITILDLYSIVRYGFYTLTLLILTVILNALHQLLPKNKSEPPMVWHWIPFIGNAVECTSIHLLSLFSSLPLISPKLLQTHLLIAVHSLSQLPSRVFTNTPLFSW